MRFSGFVFLYFQERITMIEVDESVKVKIIKTIIKTTNC